MGKVVWPITSKEDTTTQNSCWKECDKGDIDDSNDSNGDNNDSYGDRNGDSNGANDGDSDSKGDIYDFGFLVEQFEVRRATPDQPFLCVEHQHLFEKRFLVSFSLKNINLAYFCLKKRQKTVRNMRQKKRFTAQMLPPIILGKCLKVNYMLNLFLTNSFKDSCFQC